MAMTPEQIELARSTIEAEQPPSPTGRSWWNVIGNMACYGVTTLCALFIVGVIWTAVVVKYNQRTVVAQVVEPVVAAKEKERSWEDYTFAEKVEYRRPAFEDYTVPKILKRLDEFKPVINCDIDLPSMPDYGERALWRDDVKNIQAWYKEEEERLHQCIKGSIFAGEREASKFLTELFLDEMQTAENDEVVDQFAASFSTNEDMQEAYHTLITEWQIAQSEKYAENVNKWTAYSQNTLKPAVKRGGREERAYDRKIAKEESDRAFRDEHGMDPDATCEYYDERGRIKFRGKCRDYVKQSGRLINETSGWSSMWEEIGETAREMERKRLERQRREQEAYINLLLLQSEAKKSATSEPGEDAGPMGHAKHPGKPDVCNEVPHFEEFDGERAYAEGKKQGRMKRDELKSYLADKKRKAEAKYKQWYDNTSDACRGQWGTPGAKSTPGKGISK